MIRDTLAKALSWTEYKIGDCGKIGGMSGCLNSSIVIKEPSMRRVLSFGSLLEDCEVRSVCLMLYIFAKRDSLRSKLSDLVMDSG